MENWSFDSSYSFANKNFAKIFSFFVIETPVENISRRGISFEERNLDLKKLINKIKNISNDLKKNWFISKASEIESKLNEFGILDYLQFSKEIAIYVDSKSSKVKSFFYIIRCAFAHGSFNICKYNKENYYLFENKYKNRIKGRIIIKESTLLKIVDYCNNKQ